MARSFVSASSQYLYNLSTPVSGYPFAVSLWCKPPSSAVKGLFGITDNGVVNQRLIIMYQNNLTLAVMTKNGGTSRTAGSTTDINTGQWNHCIGIGISATDRRAILNGGGRDVETGSVSLPTFDTIGIGAMIESSVSLYFDGDIAEVAVWDLSSWPGATDPLKGDSFETIIPALNDGASPLLYPLGLVAYWQLFDLFDRRGNYPLTASGGSSLADHCRVILPVPPIIYPYQVVGVTESLTGTIDATSSCSAVLTIPTEDYTMGDYASLPSNDTDLENGFTEANYASVESDDGDRVPQTANGKEYALFQFRDKFDEQQAISVTWNGRSSQAPSESTVFLQIYNRNSNLWENLDSESSVGADTDFDLAGSQSTDLSYYFNDANWVSCRVYQESKAA
jgi:hypothetical protein